MNSSYFVLFLTAGSIFVLSFVALKPAFLYEEDSYLCAPRQWCNITLDPATNIYQAHTYEFSDFITHRYHLGNFIAGGSVIALIGVLMYVGNLTYKDILIEKGRLKI